MRTLSPLSTRGRGLLHRLTRPLPLVHPAGEGEHLGDDAVHLLARPLAADTGLAMDQIGLVLVELLHAVVEILGVDRNVHRAGDVTLGGIPLPTARPEPPCSARPCASRTPPAKS